MSRSLNKCDFIGNLTRDPELRYTPNGTAVVDLGIAVNESYKNKQDEWVETPVFINLVGWDKTAERIVAQYHKGDRIYVTSKLKIESWDDKKTGEKRSAPKFTVLEHWPLAKDVKVGEVAPQGDGGGEVESAEDEDEDIPF